MRGRPLHTTAAHDTCSEFTCNAARIQSLLHSVLSSTSALSSLPHTVCQTDILLTSGFQFEPVFVLSLDPTPCNLQVMQTRTCPHVFPMQFVRYLSAASLSRSVYYDDSHGRPHPALNSEPHTGCFRMSSIQSVRYLSLFRSVCYDGSHGRPVPALDSDLPTGCSQMAPRHSRQKSRRHVTSMVAASESRTACCSDHCCFGLSSIR